uniref:Uncharacterized protein n=1 Tax=Cacopsylla melanoneura TaxID=428564 RepID=A0A8D8VN03_9HEMI
MENLSQVKEEISNPPLHLLSLYTATGLYFEEQRVAHLLYEVKDIRFAHSREEEHRKHCLFAHFFLDSTNPSDWRTLNRSFPARPNRLPNILLRLNSSTLVD